MPDPQTWSLDDSQEVRNVDNLSSAILPETSVTSISEGTINNIQQVEPESNTSFQINTQRIQPKTVEVVLPSTEAKPVETSQTTKKRWVNISKAQDATSGLDTNVANMALEAFNSISTEAEAFFDAPVANPKPEGNSDVVIKPNDVTDAPSADSDSATQS
jgi:hypothetical protein